MMRKSPSAVAILLSGAMLVERHGLARGALQDEDGAICTTRALMAAVLGDEFLVPWWEDSAEAMPDTYAQALAAVGRYLGWPDWWSTDLVEEQVICWNDTGNVSAPLVCEVLREAAADLLTRRPVGA